MSRHSIPPRCIPSRFTQFRTHVPGAPNWRSVTLCASAAPRDYSTLPHGRTNVPRRDWNLWQAIAPHLPFQVDYADTGTLHPNLVEPPGVAMAMATVSARYTTDDFWIVLKGTPQGGRTGQPMAVQYRAHATTFSHDPQFDALPICWADDQIRTIAGGALRAGNRTTWAAIGLNRHISLVSNRLP